VKVRDYRVHQLELVTGTNEQLRFCALSEHCSIGFHGQRFERADGRRTDGDDPPAFAPRTRDRGSRFAAYGEAFRVDDVCFDMFDLHRLERAVADMQRDVRELNAARRKRSKLSGGEVQTGMWVPPLIRDRARRRSDSDPYPTPRRDA
jgi:hypothetical protein